MITWVVAHLPLAYNCMLTSGCFPLGSNSFLADVICFISISPRTSTGTSSESPLKKGLLNKQMSDVSPILQLNITNLPFNNFHPNALTAPSTTGIRALACILRYHRCYIYCSVTYISCHLALRFIISETPSMLRHAIILWITKK